MKKGSDSGFAIVTAIFLLVVLAALGAFMVTLSGVHQATPFQSITATRVYYGARTGLDWGIQQAVAACPVVANCAACTTCVASSSFALAGAGLSGVNVTVTCACTDHTGGRVHYIASTAERGTFGGLDYARRQMEATVSNIP